MNYKTALPGQNHNVSHNHPLKEFLVLLVGVAGVVLLVFWGLGFAVDFTVDHLSPAREHALFATFGSQFPVDPDIPAEEVAVLQGLTDSLASCMEIRYPVEVRVFDSEIVNAFAFPGGIIVVFSGLLEKVKSENGLAFVLAHELGHYKKRDHLRGMGRGLVLATISTILTGANSSISQMLVPTNEFGMAQYSQDSESAADSIALDTVHCYYGHVGGVTEFFETMQQGSHGADFGIGKYFDSHPQLVKRMGDLEDLVEKRSYSFGPTQNLSF